MKRSAFDPHVRLISISLGFLVAVAAPVALAPVAVEAATYTVTNAGDSGTGSLRWAITQANGNPGTDTIAFSISGAGPHTIQPFSGLPTITDPVLIDGFTQAGATPNTNPIDQPCNAVLKIELDGTYAGSGADGIRIAASGSTVKGLVINRFDCAGVCVETYGGNLIEGCVIGMDPSGTTSLGNYEGVELADGSSNNGIGGAAASARNVISGNNRYGIQMIEGASGNAVLGNFVGTDATGMLDRGNQWAGVYLWSNTANNTVGGTVAGARNIVAGNGWYGVRIEAGGNGNTVLGNYIGTDRTGTSGLGNAWNGVRLEDTSNNTVGGTTPGAGNVIAANGWEGVGISGTGSAGNQVLGNYIGTDASGADTLGNDDHGIRIYDGASNNTIGGTTVGARNVISGNHDHGVAIDGSGGPATGNVIQGNFIGTDATGTQALGNLRSGVDIWNASGNTVGGTTVGAGNVISSNYDHGIMISASTSTASGNVVQGNLIGTDATGTAALGNLDGVRISGNANGNMVGCTNPGGRNVISGNNQFGISISYASGNTVQGNYIGTDISGTVALGVQGVGVSLWSASSNTIGGAENSAGNLVSGNDGYGFYLGSGADSNHVVGNIIGSDCSGAGNLANLLDGIHIENSNQNVIGGITANAGNTIAFSGDDGIWVQSGSGNALLGNSIFLNDSLGIDLGGSGVTPNDPADPDTGANYLQNFPVLTLATCSGTNTNIEGTLNSTPTMAFRLEFFSNSVADPSGYGEGETYLGSTTVVTDGAGDASFDVTLPVPVPGGYRVTATATDPNNNTSEFSEWAFVMAATGSLVGGELQITWPPFTRTAEYWVYGAVNETYFEPQLTSPYQYRIATLPGTASMWSTANGVADPDSDWTYVIVAVDIAGQELVRSNACGDHDFDMTGTP
jgi:hypothetical protein